MDFVRRLLFSSSTPLRFFRLLLLGTFAFALASVAPAPVESTHLKMIVGVTDDTAKW